MKTRILITFLAVTLAACAPVAAPAQNETPVPVATFTPPSPTTTLLAPDPTAINAPVAPNFNQQVYLDPDGWFSVNLPITWKPESVNIYSGENGFFEASYLPKMMFMQQPVNVCQWLANVDSKSTYFVTLNFDTRSEPWNNLPDTCTLTTLPGIVPATIQIVIENPQADYEHRFLTIKSDAGHFLGITGTFLWLRPVGSSQEPVLQLPPIRPEDASFWKEAASLSPRFSIQEYVLPPEAQNLSPFRETFSIPADAPWVKSQTENNAGGDNTEIPVNERLKPYGYELIIDPTGKMPAQLYKDGNLLFTFPFVHVSQVFGVYTIPSVTKPIVAFVVRSVENQQFMGYLVQNNSVIEWDGFNDPRFAPVSYKGELLWVRAAENSYIQVQTSQRDIIFPFATHYETHLPVNRFRSWNDHWVLEIDGFFDGFLVEDGEIINEKFGFEEAFGWQLVKDKPFYFFRKGSRVGVSYDGNFMSLDYDEIAHGLFNDHIGDGNRVPFFGKRDGTWFYVILEAN